MPFTENAPKFLFENHARNDREWFRENKDTYDKEVVTPLRDMIEYVTPLISRIDPQIVCSPKRVSRIWRDIRMVKDGRIFRNSVWFSLSRPKERFVSKPEFFFWLSPDDCGWGCGYYHIPTPVMENVRALILKNDKTALRAMEAYEKQDVFVLEGEMYKRDRFPGQTERTKNWLNRRNLALVHNCDDPEILFGEGLCEQVKRDFEVAAPVYELFIKAEEMNIERL